MDKQALRRQLIRAADRLQFGAEKLRGAADRWAPEHKVTLGDLERDGWQGVRPCFVLSTGRSGTLFLNRLLDRSPRVLALHQPRPELIRASKRAYEEIDRAPEIFAETFKTAREELALEAARRGKVLVETNNRVTFFAPVIREVFPRAVFVHLVRHPGDFVRSGIRRGWYSGSHAHDLGRIVPVAGEACAQWAGWSPVERIGWLWNETNAFVERFRATIPAEECHFVKAEDLFRDLAAVRGVLAFMEAGEIAVTARDLETPVNAQRKGDYPRYAEWPAADRAALRRVAPLMERYGYGGE